MEKRVKIRKTVFGGAIARICCLALCLCLGLSISMTAQAASGKKVTPVTMAAVVGEEKTVTQQADKTSAALGILPAGTTVNVCGQTGSGKSDMYQIVYGNAIGYITQTACQPVCVDVAMTAALAAQAEAVKQQVAQAQAAAAALAAQQAADSRQQQQAQYSRLQYSRRHWLRRRLSRKPPFRRAAATSSSSGTPARDRWRMQSVERQHGLVRPLWHALEVAWTGFPPPRRKRTSTSM